MKRVLEGAARFAVPMWATFALALLVYEIAPSDDTVDGDADPRLLITVAAVAFVLVVVGFVAFGRWLGRVASPERRDARVPVTVATVMLGSGLVPSVLGGLAGWPGMALGTLVVPAVATHWMVHGGEGVRNPIL